MIKEEFFGGEAKEPQGSPRSNTVQLSQPRLKHMDVDVETRVESVAEGLLILHT